MIAMVASPVLRGWSVPYCAITAEASSTAQAYTAAAAGGGGGWPAGRCQLACVVAVELMLNYFLV